MAVDRRDHLHVSGNMHGVPLVYFRSERPLDAASLVRIPAMVGDREQRVTYPVFLRDRDGRLVFRYRDGGSGNGDDLYNVYDEEGRTWRRLIDGPLLSGRGEMNAYCTTPERGPDGRFHMAWVWRETPDCASNRDLGYAWSPDLAAWFNAAGRQLPLPILPDGAGLVDPVPPGGGLLNANRQLGFDNAGRPVLTYHKYDARGDLQVYAARPGAGGWQIVQVSNWTNYRWDFRGGGTIEMEVHVGDIRPVGSNRVAMTYRYPRGAGEWILDEETLRPIPGATAPRREPTYPRGAIRMESDFPGMELRRQGDSGTPPSGMRCTLVWETLGPNRDRPRAPPLPAPSMLRVIAAKEKTP